MVDIEYQSGHTLPNSKTPPLGSSVLASDKGQGGETLSDVTLPGDQTPFSYDVDYVLGDTMFSYSLEAAFEHETVMEMQPRLTLYCMRADELRPYSWNPMRSPFGIKKKHKKNFSYITAIG